MASSLRAHFALDPAVTFLNHGSFGACPRAVLDEQSRLREQMEREPVQFFVHELEPLLDEARARVADFVGAEAEDLVFVRNATTAVNGVLRSVASRLVEGDEILVTDHGYGACQNAVTVAARERGARVVVARVPFPLDEPTEVVQAISRAVTPRTRLALIDHVTSPTGLVFPIADIVRALEALGVDTLVDGAHAPGMVELDLRALGAAYYAANFHKHTCAPKAAGMLYARRDRQDALHPAVVSHGYSSERPRKRFLEEWDWVGTDDPTPALVVPFALEHLASLVDGGWPAIRAQNRALALEARALLADALAVPLPAPDSMIGSLAALPLPDAEGAPPSSALYADPLGRALFDAHRIEVPIVPWPHPPRRLVRISAHLHNDRADYEALARALIEHTR